jgi:hypothetical protein
VGGFLIDEVALGTPGPGPRGRPPKSSYSPTPFLGTFCLEKFGSDRPEQPFRDSGDKTSVSKTNPPHTCPGPLQWKRPSTCNQHRNAAHQPSKQQPHDYGGSVERHGGQGAAVTQYNAS